MKRLSTRPRAALDRINASKLGSVDERMKWLTADRKAFEASTDPAIQYAVAMLPTMAAT